LDVFALKREIISEPAINPSLFSQITFNTRTLIFRGLKPMAPRFELLDKYLPDYGLKWDQEDPGLVDILESILAEWDLYALSPRPAVNKLPRFTATGTNGAVALKSGTKEYDLPADREGIILAQLFTVYRRFDYFGGLSPQCPHSNPHSDLPEPGSIPPCPCASYSPSKSLQHIHRSGLSDFGDLQEFEVEVDDDGSATERASVCGSTDSSRTVLAAGAGHLHLDPEALLTLGEEGEEEEEAVELDIPPPPQGGWPWTRARVNEFAHPRSTFTGSVLSDIAIQRSPFPVGSNVSYAPDSEPLASDVPQSGCTSNALPPGTSSDVAFTPRHGLLSPVASLVGMSSGKECPSIVAYGADAR
jgi:hypothetical protein